MKVVILDAIRKDMLDVKGIVVEVGASDVVAKVATSVRDTIANAKDNEKSDTHHKGKSASLDHEKVCKKSEKNLHEDSVTVESEGYIAGKDEEKIDVAITTKKSGKDDVTHGSGDKLGRSNKCGHLHANRNIDDFVLYADSPKLSHKLTLPPTAPGDEHRHGTPVDNIHKIIPDPGHENIDHHPAEYEKGESDHHPTLGNDTVEAAGSHILSIGIILSH